MLSKKVKYNNVHILGRTAIYMKQSGRDRYFIKTVRKASQLISQREKKEKKGHLTASFFSFFLWGNISYIGFQIYLAFNAITLSSESPGLSKSSIKQAKSIILLGERETERERDKSDCDWSLYDAWQQLWLKIMYVSKKNKNNVRQVTKQTGRAWWS